MFRASFLMKLVLIAGLGVFAAFAWLSLPTPPRGEQPGHNHAGAPRALADGVVLSVDRTASRITISHGPLYHLGMPPMTMAFQVGDPALLDQVNAGDKVKFQADVAASGAFTVTRIERAPQ